METKTMLLRIPIELSDGINKAMETSFLKTRPAYVLEALEFKVALDLEKQEQMKNEQ